MTCDDVRDALMERAVADWGPLQSHLDECVACAGLADAIRDAEVSLEREISAFEDGGDVERALKAARQTQSRPWRPDMRHLLLAAVALLAVGGALTQIAPRSVSGSLATSSSTAASSEDRSEPRLSVPSPVVEAPLTKVQPVAPPAPASAPVEVEPIGHALDTCGRVDVLEQQAVTGDLDSGTQVCLEAVQASDALAAERLLAVNAFASGEFEVWSEHALRIVELVPDDAETHYKLALHFSKREDRASLVEHHASKALEHADGFHGEARESRVRSIHKLLTLAALKLWKQDPGDEPRRAIVEERVRAWNEVADKRSRKQIREICEMVAPADTCR